MVEKLRYLRHHVELVKVWDKFQLTPEEAVKDYLQRVNNPIIVKRDWVYPETPELIKAFARLVEAHRNGEKIEMLDDFHSDRFLDPICRACKHCPNPVRDLQYRLPGFEDL